jgi:hypothetical protein
MARKRYKPEEIVAKLRQVDVLVSQGQNMMDAIRQIFADIPKHKAWMAEAPRPAGLHKRRAGADYGFGGEGCWRRSY